MNKSEVSKDASTRSRLALPLAMVAMSFFVTGCPHNVYEVLLRPQGNGIERTLSFYREDGTSDNGQPKYEDFEKVDLTMIESMYPANGMSVGGKRHIAKGLFTNELPSDIGGHGVFSNLTTSLGETGFYAEHFRGNDDLAGMEERRNKAADRLTDWFIGWGRVELAQQPGFEKLIKFLDGDFRRDMRNFGQYALESQLSGSIKTNVDEELCVRLGQYLLERGYFGVGEIPSLVREFAEANGQGLMQRVQRLVARKMGVADGEPIPDSLAFLADEPAMEKSFEKYLAGTDAYKALLKQWDSDKKTNAEAKRPAPMDVVSETFGEWIELDWGSTPDLLTVRLALPCAPAHSNGKWDATRRELTWDGPIPEQDKTNSAHLPFTCYANWVQADEAFQKEHIGKVAVTNDDLVQYCLWRAGLDAKRGAEWDTFLSNLKIGGAWWRTVDAFRFSGEPKSGETNSQTKLPLASDYPRQLLEKAVE